MKRTILPRKLSILALSIGVTASMAPSSVFAASNLQSSLSQVDLNSSIQGSSTSYISPSIDTRSSADVRVIVQLSGNPAAVGKYASQHGLTALAETATESTVKSQQENVLDAAENKGIDLTVNYQFDTVLNGFEVTVPANKIPELSKIAGVVSIYPNSSWHTVPDDEATTDETAYFSMNTATYPKSDMEPLKQIHADWAWDHGYTGAGLKIGVIDTGVDYLHPDIKDAYKGGYDSFDQDDDPYEEVPTKAAEDPYGVDYKGTSHGTHVAGTIIGQYKGTGNIAQKGIAPGAQLYAYKVLGRNLEKPDKASGSSAQVIDGIEHAVKDGMDVINLSLGSDDEKNVNSPDSIAINNAVLSGVVAVIANGNNGTATGSNGPYGHGRYSMGAPAGSQLAISVGAVNSPSTSISGTLEAKLTNSVTSVTYATYNTDFNALAYSVKPVNISDVVGTDPVKLVYADLGSDEDYPAADIAGSIVLISRGELKYTDKVAYAQKHNAKGIILFNGNAKSGKSDADLDLADPSRDGFIGNADIGTGFDANIPVIEIPGVAGRELAKAIQANNSDTTVTFNYVSKVKPGDEITSFSSLGPSVDGNLSIKPDVSAPGYKTLSTWPAYGKYLPNADYNIAYNRISGTSMATPHVAGLALLVKQAHPEYTPFDVRAALANTADELKNSTGAPEDLYKQGAGRANVENAILTPALLEAVEPIKILDKDYHWKDVTNYNPSTSFGVMKPGSEASRTLQLKNTSNSELDYSASIVWNYGDAQHDKVSATLSKDNVSVSAKGTSKFDLQIKVANDADINLDYQGTVVLTAPGQPTLHLPFAVHVNTVTEHSTWGTTGLQEAVLDSPIVYKNDPADFTFQITAKDINYYEVDLVGMDDKTKGYFDVAATKSADEYFAPGEYHAVIGTKYHPYDSDGNAILDSKGQPAVEVLTDNIYKVQVVAITAKDNSVIPIKIDLNDDAHNFYTTYTSFRYIDQDTVAPVDSSTNSNASAGSAGNAGSSDSTGSTGSTGGTVSVAPTTSVLPASATSLVEEGAQKVSITPTTTSKDGVTTITISDNDVQAAVAKSAEVKTAIVLPVTTTDHKASEWVLNANQVKLFTKMHEGSQIIVNVDGSSIALPTSLLTSAPIGSNLKLVVKQAPEAEGKLTATVAGSTVIGTPVSFEAKWTNTANSTNVSVPTNLFIKKSFTVAGEVKPKTAGVLFEANGLVTPVASVFKPQDNGTTLVMISSPGFATYAAVSKPSPTFTDITSSKLSDVIKTMNNKWIVQGTSAATFSPQSNLTRAEFTALLTRAFGIRTDMQVSFSDVKGTDWYAQDIAAAYKAGLILGIGNGKFAPSQPVTRQELTVILDRALKLTGKKLQVAHPSFSTYTDTTKVAPYAENSLRTLSDAGVVSADQGTSFNPTAPATREVTTAALYALLNKLELID